MRWAVQSVIDHVTLQAPDTFVVASANHDNLRLQRVIRALGFVEDSHDEIYSKPLQRRVSTVCFRQA